MSAPRPILNPDLARIADVLIGSLAAMSHGARGSGRTARMLERATPEYRVIVCTADHAKHLVRQARDAGQPVRAALPANPRQSLLAPRSVLMFDGARPTLPDHTWVEARVLALIEDAIEQVQFELDQVDVPTTPEQRLAQRQNYLAREAGVKPAQTSSYDWGRR